jgi:hypothetical protein
MFLLMNAEVCVLLGGGWEDNVFVTTTLKSNNKMELYVYSHTTQGSFDNGADPMELVAY